MRLVPLAPGAELIYPRLHDFHFEKSARAEPFDRFHQIAESGAAGTDDGYH